MTNTQKKELERITRLIPGYDPWATCEDCKFDFEAAQRAIDFFPSCIVHVKGDLAGKKYQLEPHERAITANIFGWKKPNGKRRYKEVFYFVPRKNSKTTWAAGTALYVFFFDGEIGAECYCAAAEKEQATLLFGQAAEMVRKCKPMRERVKIYTAVKSIVCEETNSSFKAISADADTKHGYNSQLVIIDELHALPDRELVDVLVTSTGSRTQPLIIYITTSDYDRESICNETYDRAKKIRDGIINNVSFLPVIYEATRDDDWRDVKTWEKANPNIGKSVSYDAIAFDFKKAQEVPSFENTFKRLHLNMRTEQENRWLPMDKWDVCGGEFDNNLFAGGVAWGGLDLSSTRDLTAFVLSFKREELLYWISWFWIPEETAAEHEKRDRIPYLTWHRQGLIEFTPGNSIDYGFIRKRINEIAKQYTICDIRFDPWNATQLATELAEEDGFKMVQFRQGFISMNEPCKEFERLVMAGQFRHGNNAILREMAANVAIREDPSGNIRPVKPERSSGKRIDGIVAGVMSLAGSMFSDNNPSVYESRGLVVI